MSTSVAASLATADPVTRFACRNGDRCLVLSHRLQQCITHAPQLEEELAIANIALDLLGQARALYSCAAARLDLRFTEDDFAFARDAASFDPPALVVHPNTDFAVVMARQLLHDLWASELWAALRTSASAQIAAIATRASKETAYHLMHATTWVVTLGDSTPEARAKITAAFDALWPRVDELFAVGDLGAELATIEVALSPAGLRLSWDRRLDAILAEATLIRPAAVAAGARAPDIRAELEAVIDELNELHRQHPGAQW